MSSRPTKRWGLAWVGLCVALAVHVVDEAATDFLSLWNPFVKSLRSGIPWIPMPTFTFETWMGGLIVALVVLLLLSRYVFRGARWMRPGAYVFSTIMIGNGVVHIAASLYLGRAAPGVYSAPLLLAAAGWLFVSTWRCSDAGGHGEI